MDAAPGDGPGRIAPSQHGPLVRELADRILSVGDRRVVLGNSGNLVTDFPISSTPSKPL